MRTRPGSTDMASMGIPASSRRRCSSVVKRTFASLLRPERAHCHPATLGLDEYITAKGLTYSTLRDSGLG